VFGILGFLVSLFKVSKVQVNLTTYVVEPAFPPAVLRDDVDDDA